MTVVCLLSATTKPVCSVTVIVGSTSINVTLGSDVSRDRMTSGEVFVYDYARGGCCCDLQYDVVLYECDQALWCCDHCDLTELALHPLTSVSSTSGARLLSVSGIAGGSLFGEAVGVHALVIFRLFLGWMGDSVHWSSSLSFLGG